MNKEEISWSEGLKYALAVCIPVFAPFIGMIIVMLILNSMGITWNW